MHFALQGPPSGTGADVAPDGGRNAAPDDTASPVTTRSDTPTPPDPSLAGRARTHAWGVVAIIATSVLWFARLGHRSLWADEAFSWSTSDRSLISLLKLSATTETNGALYAFVLKMWMGVFGESEAAMRSLSAVFTLASAIALYVLATRLGTRRMAAITVALYGVNGSVVTYAQNVRHYAMVTLLACLSMLAFEREVRRPTAHTRRWWLASLCVLPFVHVLATTLVLAQLASLFALRPPERAWRRRLLVAGISMAATLPFVVLIASRDEGQSIITFSRSTLVEAVKFLAGGRSLIAVMALTLLAIGAGAALWDRPSTKRWPIVLGVAWGVVPPVLLFLTSVLTPVLLGRYVLFTVPGIALAGAFGIDHLLVHHRHRARRNRVLSLFEEGGRARLLVSIAVVLLALGWVGGASSWHRSQHHDDWRTMAVKTFRSAQPGDGVLFAHDSMQLFFAYYRDRMGITGDAAPASEYPKGAWGAFGTGDQKYAVFGAAEVSDIETRRRRLWIVVERQLMSRPPAASLADILRRYKVLEKTDYHAGTLYLVERGV